jgi:hypothetical protein
VRARILDTSGPRATETMKWCVGVTVLGWIVVAAAESDLHHSLDTDANGSHLLQHDALRHPLSDVFN